MKIHYFQHVPFEELGIIRQWAEIHKHSLSATRFFTQDSIPVVADIDMLIVMGGPMGVCENHHYPWLTAEIQFIQEMIRQKKKVLGICLGAQLIASALGAKVFPNAYKEIGWFPVVLTPSGREFYPFKSFPAQFTAFHWHGDTFELPDGSSWLAESEACRHQAFSFEEHVLGLQFHIEVTPANVESLIQHCGSELQEAKFIQSENQLRSDGHQFESMGSHVHHLLDQFAL